MNISHHITLLLLLFSSALYADTIELSNGKIMEGSFTGRDGDTIKFEVDGIGMSFQTKDVKNISMGSATKPTTQQAAAKSGPVTIDAGTTLTIRLTDTLDSGRQATGHKFAGVLEGALIKNGVTVALAGSKVYGVISEAVKARRLAGSAKLMITITDINIKGQITPISTSAINALTESTGRGTAGKVARGAAIGALADGSDGARTGAKVGLGVAVLKGGNQVVVPAGTLLDFKLAAPLSSK
jgi:hypothetical protein